jgi:hypothetical protein
VEADVRAVLAADPAVQSMALVGSRARGNALPCSDWDFEVRSVDFTRTAAKLPEHVSAMGPLGQLWDPLSPTWCYMLMLRGPTKVDLIFDEPHHEKDPWVVTPDTLQDVDDHFWDWTWWLATKDQRGRYDLVRSELAKLYSFLLEPMGTTRPPSDVAAAVRVYTQARGPMDGELESEVRSGLRRLGYDV